MEELDQRWRKSSFSGNGGECVEIGQDAGGGILLRDTKDNGRGQVHHYSTAEWAAFLSGVRNGEFDLDAKGQLV